MHACKEGYACFLTVAVLPMLFCIAVKELQKLRSMAPNIMGHLVISDAAVGNSDEEPVRKWNQHQKVCWRLLLLAAACCIEPKTFANKLKLVLAVTDTVTDGCDGLCWQPPSPSSAVCVSNVTAYWPVAGCDDARCGEPPACGTCEDHPVYDQGRVLCAAAVPGSLCYGHHPGVHGEQKVDSVGIGLAVCTAVRLVWYNAPNTSG